MREHTLHDHLEVLAGDARALELVDLAGLRDDVLLYRCTAGILEEVIKVCGAVREKLTAYHRVTLLHEGLARVREDVLGIGAILLALTLLRRHDNNLVATLVPYLHHDTVELRDGSWVLRRALLEHLLDTRETLRDVATYGRSTTGMEGTHRKLGTRLADSLCSNGTDGLTEINRLLAREVHTVTGGTDTVPGLTRHRRTDRYGCDGLVSGNLCCVLSGKVLTLLEACCLGSEHAAADSVREVDLDAGC